MSQFKISLNQLDWISSIRQIVNWMKCIYWNRLDLDRKDELDRIDTIGRIDQKDQ